MSCSPGTLESAWPGATGRVIGRTEDASVFRGRVTPDRHEPPICKSRSIEIEPVDVATPMSICDIGER